MEHIWLFTHKKEGDPEKEEASSALWRHSKEEHGGSMRVEDWRSSVISSHFTALNRQITEAVLISGEGGGGKVRLLNSKHEFGANLLLEVVVMKGEQVLGHRNPKRKRWPHTPQTGEDAEEARAMREEAQVVREDVREADTPHTAVPITQVVERGQINLLPLQG